MTAFGCALTIGFAPIIPLQAAAFPGGGAALLIASLVVRTGGGEMSRLFLVLSGVIVSVFFTA